MQNGIPLNIPLAVNLHIEKFSGGSVTEVESGSTNIVIDQYHDGRWYATQRPGINQLEDASVTIADERGRGGYYWDAVGDKYIVNNDTVYKGSYAGSTMAISTGTERVFMEVVGDNLVIIDQENNEGWYITSAAPTAINSITDLDFPPNQTPALTLARGGAELNGKLYVPTTNGGIHESDVRDPTSWGALNVRNAELESDKGVYLDKHHEHIVFFGTRTAEFFQDVANPTGSTLAPRLDISYETGCINEDCAFRVGENLYFVGQDRSNAIAVYMLSGFQLVPISGEDMSTFLTTAITQDDIKLKLSGFTSGQREFLFLTLHNTPADIVPTETLVYSSKRTMWGFWDVQIPDVDKFPLVDWMPSTRTRAGEGILTNGDLVTVLDDFNPQDTVGSQRVYEVGVYETGVYSATGGSGTPIPFEIITGVITGGTPRRKRMGDLWSIHTPTDASEDLTVSFADEQNTTYETHGTIDASDSDARLNRGGSFRRRNIKVSGVLTKQYQGEMLQTTVRAG